MAGIESSSCFLKLTCAEKPHERPVPDLGVDCPHKNADHEEGNACQGGKGDSARSHKMEFKVKAGPRATRGAAPRNTG